MFHLVRTAAEKKLRRQLQASLQALEPDRLYWRPHKHTYDAVREIHHDPWRGEIIF